jgi:murein DD-endopeptidase MepM/ murein hydrolase activator NlpD
MIVLIEGKKVTAAEQVGIYKFTETGPVVHFGLKPGQAPNQFLEINKPAKGNDGTEWMIGRKKLTGK